MYGKKKDIGVLISVLLHLNCLGKIQFNLFCFPCTIAEMIEEVAIKLVSIVIVVLIFVN